VAAVAALLDTLSTPSTDGVGEVYQWMKNILGITAAQQVESTLQHRVKISVLTSTVPRPGGQRATQWASKVGMASLPMWISA
jgi:hypothetical protein